MSHFTVAVILDKKIDRSSINEAIELALLPFDQNISSELRIEKSKIDLMNYLSSQREEKQIFYNEYDTNNKKFIKKYPERFTEYILKMKKEDEENPLTVQEMYEEYIDGRIVDDGGNLLTDYNQAAKWDWYVIGGRWANSLVISNDSFLRMEGIPERNIKKLGKKQIYQRVDFCRLKDVEWDKMFLESIGGDYNKAEEKFLKEFPNLNKKDFKNYIDENKYKITYAILDEHQNWYESGETIISGTNTFFDEDESSFAKLSADLYKKTDPENWIVIVDCHI